MSGLRSRPSAYVPDMRKTNALWACLAVACMIGCDAREIADCGDICETFDDCVIVDIDVTDCIDRCEDYADVSEGNEEQVDLCNDCLDAMECSPACNDQCAGIIPPL